MLKKLVSTINIFVSKIGEAWLYKKAKNLEEHVTWEDPTITWQFQQFQKTVYLVSHIAAIT